MIKNAMYFLYLYVILCCIYYDIEDIFLFNFYT